MREGILAYELPIRLGCFLGVLAIVALLEVPAPRRRRHLSRWARWPGNLGVAAVNAALVRALIPAGGVGVALLAADRDWGVLNRLAMPAWLAIPISVLALDLAIYLQHVLFHAVPALWRVHRVHHADPDFDVTTGARFHPIEIVLSMGLKLAVVAALGIPAVAVLVFEVLLNATSMFNHGNLRLPVGIDRVLRRVLVTPDMHRVHHSILPREADSNFGFNVPWWDRLLGTYRDQPADGHEGMSLGVGQFRSPVDQRLDRMLLQPLRGDVGAYPIGRRGGA